MRNLIMLSLLMTSNIAFGQDVGDTAWLLSDQPSKRFLNDSVDGQRFRAKTKVNVLFIEGDRARVKSPDGFGWIDRSSLTLEAPESDFNIDALLQQMNRGGAAGGASSTSLPITIGGGE